jgi:hypothetical protein
MVEDTKKLAFSHGKEFMPFTGEEILVIFMEMRNQRWVV